MLEESKKGSKGQNVLSGKALFQYDPTMFQDDEEAADMETYEEREEEEEKKEEEPDYTKNGHTNGGIDGQDGQNVDTNLF